MQDKQTPIYTWAMRSSQPRLGGQVITYLVQIDEKGELSCDCPGWIFKKKNKDRSCKHVREVKSEAEEILTAWRNGEQLPTFEKPITNGTKNKKLSEIKYGRLIEFD